MAAIALPCGTTVLLDEADFSLIAPYKWTALRTRGYAYVHGYKERKGRVPQWIYMHRLLLSEPVGRVDHVNGNGLDNRRSNLRVVTHSQNLFNGGKKRGVYSSRYRGVFWHTKAQKWCACVTLQGHRHHLGFHVKEEDAALAYNAGLDRLNIFTGRKNVILTAPGS